MPQVAENFDGTSRRGFVGAGLLALLAGSARAAGEAGALTPIMFGARGDGSDDTAAVQAMRDAAAARGLACDGLGGSYSVRAVRWGSGDVARNFHFVTLAGATDFAAPMTIDGTATPQASLRFENVHVDGSRALQSGIVAPAEDGGRHGWRLVGRVSDVVLRRCSAVRCAGDGLALFSAGARSRSDDADHCFRRISVVDCAFLDNRRHGGSGDSLTEVSFTRCRFHGNGADLPEGGGNDGARGARWQGRAYGRPFDMEGYGVGSGFDGVSWRDCDFTSNVTGFLVQDTVSPDKTPGFTARRALSFRRCAFDEPSGDPSNFPIQVVVAGYDGAAAVFEDISLTDCRIAGTPWFANTAGLRITGGRIETRRPLKAILTHCGQVQITAPSNAAEIYADGRTLASP